MGQHFSSTHNTTDGAPDGGRSSATGVEIVWQKGPLVDAASGRHLEQNGAFVETVLEIVADRIGYYQDTQFNCAENGEALGHIAAALEALRERQTNRARQGVAGTHTPHEPVATE